MVLAGEERPEKSALGNQLAATVGAALIAPSDPGIVAIASDVPLPAATVPVVDLDDIDHIVDILIRHAAPLDAVLAAMETR